jgi:hypothetical protein
MSSVRITATGDEALSVEVLLGDNSRGWHDIEPGESKDLSVGGNQTLSVNLAASAKVAVKRQEQGLQTDPFIDAPEKPFITPEADELPVGVDVTAEDEGREAQSEAGQAEVGAVNVEDEAPDETPTETQSIGPGDVGDIGALFGGVDESEEAEEAENEASVISTLEADSPLEVGSLSDLPSPFDTEEEAEDTGDEKAQA